MGRIRVHELCLVVTDLLEGFRPPAEHGVWGSWPSYLDPKGGEVLPTPGWCSLVGGDIGEDVTSHITECPTEDQRDKQPSAMVTWAVSEPSCVSS